MTRKGSQFHMLDGIKFPQSHGNFMTTPVKFVVCSQK